MRKVVKTDAELIFDTDKVYKRFTTSSVDTNVLNDLIRLDKQANPIPHFLGILPYLDTPFCSEALPDDTQILVMAYLPEQYFLTKITERGELTDTILQKMAHALYSFHSKMTIVSESFGGNYLLNRFTKDRELVADKVILNADVASYHKGFTKTLDSSVEIIQKRYQNNRLVEGHGDLNLDHIHLQKDTLTFIDFSHNTKYRFDDVSRDIAGIYLHFIELGKKDFATAFLSEYRKLSNDADLNLMVNLQVAKKVLVKYFIYIGGFDPKHYDEKMLQSVINTIIDLGNVY